MVFGALQLRIWELKARVVLMIDDVFIGDMSSVVN